MERVSIISGKLPIIFVAPHGYDGNDENTGLMAEYMAESIDAYAVINRGWERDDKVDYFNDKADCNNVLHCHEDVVREEFLNPIIRYKNKILKKHDNVFIYYIHGMANKHRVVANNMDLDVVVGYGAGTPNSFSCELKYKDLLCHMFNEQLGITTYEGRKGGVMSGWGRNNMNQLFRKWYFDSAVQSMQLEIIYELRNSKDLAALTAEYLATTVKEMLDIKNFASTKTYKSY